MHGGHRIGAGRKQGFAAKSAEEARIYISQRLAGEIEPITEALISKAKGGDLKAVRELFDRAWGRPRQELALDVNEPEPDPERQEELHEVADAINTLVRINGSFTGIGALAARLAASPRSSDSISK